MKKISFKNEDHSRCLLTDMLPYELPLIFSNDGLFMVYNSYVNQKLHADFKNFFEAKFVEERAVSYRIPFDYKIRKASGDTLKLSIMHPANQIAFIGFYRDYDSLIIALCRRSSFSLRFPSSCQSNIARHLKKTKDRPLRGAAVDLDAIDFSQDEMYPSSYFSYKKYNLIYKFYDSYEYQRLEKKFSQSMKFDISKCFYHIYTHTIAWAVKDKQFAKRTTEYVSFEGKFDTLMQRANYKETNGIIVGPEISRIFAEIILQKIDFKVEEALQRLNLVADHDYAVRRYVDDYFVYSNSVQTLEEIKRVYADALEEYRLYLNNSKTTISPTPAVTGVTVAKMRVREAIQRLFSHFVEQGSEDFKLRRLSRSAQIARNFIQEIKAISYESDADIQSVSGVVLSVLQKRTIRLMSKAKVEAWDVKSQEAMAAILNIVVEISSYIASMDVRVRPIYVISQMYISINKEMELYQRDIMSTVRNKMMEELSLLMRKCDKFINFGIEKINLMLAANYIDREAFLAGPHARAAFEMVERAKAGSAEGLNYFHIVTILYCVKDSSEHEDVRNSVYEYVIKTLESLESPTISAEMTMLVFDLISFPYFNNDQKEVIFRSVYKKEFTNARFYVNEISRLRWFIDWGEVSIERLLKKKELRPAYEA